MVDVNVAFVSPAGLAAVDRPTRDFLSALGFSAQQGQVVASGPPVESDFAATVFVGVGGRPWTGDTAVRALADLSLPEGTSIRPTWFCPGLAHTDQLIESVSVAVALRGWSWSESPDAGTIIARAVRRCRDWTNASGADLYPERFAELAVELAAASDLAVEVLPEEQLRQEGFGGLLGVGAGSRHRPCLVDLRYRPKNSVGRVTLIGKGITFDTGGLSLKSPAAMAQMRMDKVGASVVLAVMSVLSELGVQREVRALLPLAENMIGPDATRPGDVVTARDGRPILIVDTDFEGRVILADALSYAGEEDTDAIVDIASLTYQVVTALGPSVAGLFSSNEGLADALLEAAETEGEGLWQLPLVTDYLDQVRWRDGVKNHPEQDAGRAITAALFCRDFVPDHVPWAHLDITGPAWVGPASADGATGFGVRTLLRWLRSGLTSDQ